MAKVDSEHIEAKEPRSSKLIIALSLIGFFSGLVLVLTYLTTLPAIEANKAEALEQAIFEVLPHTKSYIPLSFENGSLSEVESEINSPKELIYLGIDSLGSHTGFAIPGEKAGYQDLIKVLYGFRPENQTIIGMQVLESKETPGLGDKIFKDADFRQNFKSLDAKGSIVLVKKGEKRERNEVEAISGATISSKAIARLLDESVNEWRGPIMDYRQREEHDNE